MNNLFLHIRFLLRHHECVIVPGIGAFLSHRRVSYVDKATGLLMPPSREISFNASISSNDGLLAHSIARRDRLSYEEAMSTLDASVASLADTLRAEREVEIPEVGTLQRDDEGRLSFTPEMSADRYARLLGYHPIAKDAEATEIAVQSEDAQRKSRRFRPDKYYYIPIPRKFAKTAAIFICILALCSGLFLPLSSDTSQKEYASVVPIEKVTEVLSEKHPDTPSPTEKEADTVTEPRIINEADCHGEYYGIVGSFRTKEEAEKYLRGKEEWNGSMTLIASEKMYKVCAAHGSDISEVSSEMNSDHISAKFGEYWIWKAL